MLNETSLSEQVRTKFDRADRILLGQPHRHSNQVKFDDFFVLQMRTLDDQVLCTIAYTPENGEHLYYRVFPEVPFWEAPPTEESLNGIVSLLSQALERLV